MTEISGTPSFESKPCESQLSYVNSMALSPSQLYRSVRAMYRRMRKQSVFEKIYQDNLWGDAESRSGSGSGLAATEKIRSGLMDTIQRLGIQSVVDAPCGDFYWLSKLDLGQRLTSYRGYDIVPQVIANNQKMWGAKNISFQAADLVKTPLPKADLILCRHLLIHLTLEDGLKVLRNFKDSGSRYLMVTNQPQAKVNDEILFTGSYRPVNLSLPPFSFPKPMFEIDDAQSPEDTSVAAVFDLTSLPL